MEKVNAGVSAKFYFRLTFFPSPAAFFAFFCYIFTISFGDLGQGEVRETKGKDLQALSYLNLIRIPSGCAWNFPASGKRKDISREDVRDYRWDNSVRFFKGIVRRLEEKNGDTLRELKITVFHAFIDWVKNVSYRVFVWRKGLWF